MRVLSKDTLVLVGDPGVDTYDCLWGKRLFLAEPEHPILSFAGDPLLTYTFREVPSADGGTSAGNNARQRQACGGMHAETFFDARLQVGHALGFGKRDDVVCIRLLSHFGIDLGAQLVRQGVRWIVRV